jgi:hypothetical protein
MFEKAGNPQAARPPLAFSQIAAGGKPRHIGMAECGIEQPGKIATIDALEDKLSAAKVDFEFHRYLAHHAFANETAVGPARIAATQSAPVWAPQAWDRTLHFFGRTLG